MIGIKTQKNVVTIFGSCRLAATMNSKWRLFWTQEIEKNLFLQTWLCDILVFSKFNVDFSNQKSSKQKIVGILNMFFRNNFFHVVIVEA